MNTERDKFLTEAMGECWHKDKYWLADLYTPQYECRCGIRRSPEEAWNNCFSTWEGFGKLWEWSRKQEWFEDFQWCLIDVNPRWKLINPDRFADAVCNYLKEIRK